MTRTADPEEKRALWRRLGTIFCVVAWAGSLVFFALDAQSFESELKKATQTATARVIEVDEVFSRRSLSDDSIEVEWLVNEEKRTARIPVGGAYDYGVGDKVPISYAPSDDDLVFLENDDKYFSRNKNYELILFIGIGGPLAFAANAIWQSFKPSSRRRTADQQRVHEKSRARRKAQDKARRTGRRNN